MSQTTTTPDAAQTSLETMTGPQLVAEYNRLAAALGDGARAVQRFSTRQAAIRRIIDLRGRMEVHADAPSPAFSELTVQVQCGGIVARGAGGGGGRRSAPRPAALAPEPVGPTQAPNISAARPIAEWSIRQLTEEFNRLVPEARALGIAWAKHHNSAFERKDVAVRQVERLRAEIAGARS